VFCLLIHILPLALVASSREKSNLLGAYVAEEKEEATTTLKNSSNKQKQKKLKNKSFFSDRNPVNEKKSIALS
jgi:dsDNA-binding SOS-regulon protein